jgi:phage-related protein
MAVAGGHAAVPPDGKRDMGNPDGAAGEAEARVLLCLYREHLVALHGFIKKTRATPDEDLATARKRLKELALKGKE